MGWWIHVGLWLWGLWCNLSCCDSGGLNRWKHRKLNQTPDPAVLAVFAKGGIVLLAPLA